MSVDREYRVKISTELNGNAASQTADDLKDLGKHAQTTGENVKLLETHGREFHLLCNKLNEVIPGVGQALQAAFNPELIGVIALITAVELAKSLIEGYQKKLEDLEAAAKNADFADAIKAQADALRAAEDAADDYHRKLVEIAKGQHGITSDLAAQLQLMAAIQAAQQQQADAEKTLAEAKLKEDEALGRISPSNAIIRRGEIEKRYAQQQAQAQQEQFVKEQKAREAALDKAAHQQTELNLKRDEATQKYNQAVAKQAFVKTPTTEKDVEKAQQEADEAFQKAKKEALIYGGDDYTLDKKLPSWLNPRILELQEEAREKQAAANLKKRLHVMTEQASHIDLHKLEADKTAAEDAASANEKTIADIRDQMNTANRNQTAPEVRNARSAAEQASEQNIDLGTRQELMSRARDLQREFTNRGAAFSKQDAAELLQIINMGLGKALQQGDNALSKQEFEREKQALIRLIESKGK